MKLKIISLSILLCFCFCVVYGEVSKEKERETVMQVLQLPKQITNMDWMFLEWKTQVISGSVKKVFDKMEEEDGCSFGDIRFEKEKGAISVPILYSEGILRNSKQERLDIVERNAIAYLRIFDLYIWSGKNMSMETLSRLKNVFRFEADCFIEDQKGGIADVVKIGSYEFGEKKLPVNGK